MRPRVLPEEPQHGPVYHFIRKFWWIPVAVAAVVIPVLYLTPLYFHHYVPEELTPYTIKQTLRNDDTLRIAFIGDSWADYHTSLRGDTMIANTARRIFTQPVKCFTRGKKGAQSKEIYFFMFSDKTEEHSYEPDRCTQPLIEEHPDYCVIFAGINDVTYMKPTSYYATNMRFIVNLLLHNSIRPVVMEIPLVNFKYPYTMMRKRDKLYYWTTSAVMGTLWNKGADYHHSLKEMLDNNHLNDSILYISARQWNPQGSLDTTMFLEDHLHLNLAGYHKLDSCIATEIIRDYTKRNTKRHSAIIHQ